MTNHKSESFFINQYHAEPVTKEEWDNFKLICCDHFLIVGERCGQIPACVGFVGENRCGMCKKLDDLGKFIGGNQ